jgi:hypothetical protein
MEDWIETGRERRAAVVSDGLIKKGGHPEAKRRIWRAQ